MPIKLSCPSCSKRVAVPEKFVGKKCKCPRCGGVIVVPEVAVEANAGREVDGAKPQADGAADAPVKSKPPLPKPNLPKPIESKLAATQNPSNAKKHPARRLITWERVIVVLCFAGAGVGVYRLYQHYQQPGQVAAGSAWEAQNKAKITSLNSEARKLADEQKSQEAFEKYDALLDLLVAGNKLSDPEIIAIYQEAGAARRRLGQEIAQARADSHSAAVSRPVVRTPATIAIATTAPGADISKTPVAPNTGPETSTDTTGSQPIAKIDQPIKTPATDTPKPAATAPIDIPLASTRPAGSEDEATRLRDVFNSLLQQGTNALAAGEYVAALDTLQDAKQLFEKKMRGRSLAAGSPEHIALMHGLALAYQLVQKPERASPLFENNSPLDRVCNSKGASRQILITRAALDATQGYLAMRTVVSLSTYLKEHPDELDSELLDLLFTALQKADERVTNRELMLDPSIKLYEGFNARLEATKPGQKRWGIKWVPAQQFGAEMANRQRMIAAYDATKSRAEQALAAVNAAEANLETIKRGGSPAAINAAANRVTNLTSQRVLADKAAATAKAAIPPVPALTKDDFRRILTPHDVEVVASKSPKSTASVADGTSRAITFSLGGSTPTPKAPATATGSTPPAATATYEPPPAAPPSRRTFTRSATGFAVAPDLLLTSASAVSGAKRIVIEFPNSTPVDAVIERVGDDGMALLRITGIKLNYVSLASEFAGGPVVCMAFPEVSVFGITLESLTGKALTPRDEGWKVALAKHPRLPGAPLLDESGSLVGMEIAERDDLSDRLPAMPLSKIKAFLAVDLPSKPSANPKMAAVVQITAAFEK